MITVNRLLAEHAFWDTKFALTIPNTHKKMEKTLEIIFFNGRDSTYKNISSDYYYNISLICANIF